MIRFTFLAACAVVSACAAAPPVAGPDASLAGRWMVDLSTSDSGPYLKAMQLDLAADGSVTGSFYDSTIEAGRWKTDRGRTCVSFRTTDGVGPYHSAACLSADGRSVSGQTWAEHRTFLFNWNAARE